MTFNIIPIPCTWFIVFGILILFVTFVFRHPILLRYGAPVGVVLALLGFSNILCS